MQKLSFGRVPPHRGSHVRISVGSLILFVCLTEFSHAQIAMYPSAFSCRGGTGSDGQSQVECIIGQSVAGTVSKTNTVALIGFVYLHGANILPDVVVESNPTLTPAYELKQNFPNPFNPSPTISFSIPAGGPVSLSFLELLGREVAVLVNQNLPAGNQAVSRNAGAVSISIDCMSGISIVDMKKLIGLKLYHIISVANLAGFFFAIGKGFDGSEAISGFILGGRRYEKNCRFDLHSYFQR